ncbi:methyl-accepting chemotaxis protein [Aureimonas psammosilenae]|uniref:methyl-accepting chemotaxis protein n=1 Tax=Aureimonas psammosilenae TaxID=2495496 RepID=UPI001F2FF7D7|nr:HAMP domain-containing methyl-accepting chemotaxis protein [Aureimonas psammosilenae]
MLKNFRISTKIIATVVGVSFIGLALSSLAALQIARIDREYSRLVTDQDTAVVDLVRAGRNASEIAYASYKVFAYDGASNEAKVAANMRVEAINATGALLDDVSKAFPDSEEAVAKIRSEFNEIIDLSKQVVAAGLTNQDAVAKPILGELDLASLQFASDYRELRDRFLKETQSEADRLTSSTWSTIYILVAGTLLGMIFGIFGAITVASKGITKPLSLLSSRMKDLAEGHLDVAVEGTDRRDEVGAMAKAVQVFKDAAHQNKQLELEAATARDAQATSRERQAAIDNAKAEDLRVFVHAVEAGFDRLSSGDLTVRMNEAVASEFEPIRAKFNASVEQLEDTIGSVVGAVGSMRVGLNQITVAASDLSQRTEQQAASLEETVAALSEVARGVNGTAQSADDARAAATLAQREAEKGGAVVAQTVAAMAQIETSSNKIGNIISVIDEIAFQTNLLALNAGVEAARAGEAGRGFAVVAQEVRGLAQRSAEAAKEIKDLISTSSAQVAAGVELVSASGRSLEQIVAQVGGVATVVAEMAHSAREQSVSLREVSTAADQMDKVTQQNAAMVEETTAAAQSLSSETEELAQLTERFQTAAGANGASAARGARASASPRSTVRNASVPVRQMRQTEQTRTARDEWAEF